MTDLTFGEFISKLSVTFIPFLFALAWLIVRSLNRSISLFSGIELERVNVLKDLSKVKDLQQNTWAINSSQVQNFSAITIAIVLLVVVFVIEKELNIWSDKYLNFVILVIGTSSLLYAFSLQFWNCAIDKYPDPKWLLSQRKIATTLQVIGWNGLYLSVILCVSFASTICGLILSIAGSIGLIATYELKNSKKDNY